MSVGRLVPRDSDEYRWVQNVVRSVETLTGRPTRWTGDLYEETEPDVAGSVLDDGAMTLSRQLVLQPAVRAYTAGRPLTPTELIDTRDAVLTAVHEAKHLTNALGDEAAPGATPVYAPDTLALEEGLTESWAHQNVDDVIRDVGLDRAQPELRGLDSADAYPAYTAATGELVRGVADVAGLSPAQVRDGMDQADRAQRWSAIADLVIDQRLADVLPDEDRSAVRTQLIRTMRPHLAVAAAAQVSDQLTAAAKANSGRQAAGRAVIDLSTTTAGLEDQYRNAVLEQPSQAAEVDHLRKFLGESTPRTSTYRGSDLASAVPSNVRRLSHRREQGPDQGRE
ncbi:hypothetical protein BWI15_37870 [Kribbella sp. ALI-6-A]|uniref:hypothetical protein n=1 Tax=Kribbella sp. ALI-6-A TaxID=1933817 RepID=UPI00097C163A|nr:hypothetical protein [Kribbella sp. ALI-6-A]ONI68744.1 hypothetical protein BWI15_37870 [Kribbella sp. ALI-6-A]